MQAKPESQPVDTSRVMPVITDEDYALDREIEALAKENEANDVIAKDESDVVVLKPKVEHPDLLSEFVENYKPADSHASLEEQIFKARSVGADSIEAEDVVFKNLLGRVPDEAYIVYKNIKLYRVGQVEAGVALDSQTMESRLYGKKK